MSAVVGDVGRPAGRLPAELTSFVGRRAELATLRSLLGTSRLVTLTGMSGVGKTRLAVQIANECGRTFASGAWFVDLSRLTDVELLATTVSAVLGVAEQSSGGQLDVLAGYLEDKHLLLVLDTCEHLVDGCAIFAEVLLRAAPRLRVLATSREPLDVIGEHTMEISPLTAPPPGDPPCYVESEALSLFVERAGAVVPGFVPDAEDRVAISSLCHRLEGIPLAIELAAVRLRGLSVDQIVARLDDRFRGLGTARTSRGRHQTLHAAVGWSHELCTPAERRLWARLSVFAGDFDAAAVEWVCAVDGDEDVLETLTRLVAKSIVVRDQQARRYRMLDTIRDYGAQRLAKSGEHTMVQGRHRDWILELTRQATTEAMTDRQFAWLDRVRLEHANLRRALEFCLTTPAQERTGLRMAADLWPYWVSQGLSGEGKHWLQLGVRHATEPDELRADVIWSLAQLTLMHGGDTVGARPYVAEARDLAMRLGDGVRLGRADQVAGQAALFAGDMTGAACHLEAALERFRKTAEDLSLHALMAVPQLAAAYCMSGDPERAARLCEAGGTAGSHTGERWFSAYRVWMLGVCRWMLGDTPGAVAASHEALRLQQGAYDRVGRALVLDALGWYAMAGGDAERAAVLGGAAQGMWDVLGRPHFGTQEFLALQEGCAAQARGMLGDQAYEEALRAGREISVDELVARVLSGRALTSPPDSEHGTGAHDDPQTPLTRRELEVAELVADGLSNRQIAERLVIAKRTADSHIEHILAKLNVGSRAQVARWVAERGTVDRG